MPPQQPTAGAPRTKRCRALTTGGAPCARAALPGLTVCKSHGGGTAASGRVSTVAKVEGQAHKLWGITTAGSISVEEELKQLASNKIADITALRLKISGDAIAEHIGVLVAGRALTEYDIIGTVQSKEGTQKSVTRSAGVSVWVQELHKTEGELVIILKLLHEVTGGSEEVDTRRLRMQTARETARLMRAFPGLSVDDVALQIAKKAS